MNCHSGIQFTNTPILVNNALNTHIHIMEFFRFLIASSYVEPQYRLLIERSSDPLFGGIEDFS
jgi:hypothetical protein